MSGISEHIKDHYKVVGIVPGEVIYPGFGKVDFRTISKEVADQLFQKGCKHLKAKQKRKSSTEE